MERFNNAAEIPVVPISNPKYQTVSSEFIEGISVLFTEPVALSWDISSESAIVFSVWGSGVFIMFVFVVVFNVLKSNSFFG